MLSRRGLLALGVGLAAVVPGCSADSEPTGLRRGPTCVARPDLPAHGEVGGLPLVYEISERRSRFTFDPHFHAQLSEWAGSLADVVAGRPDQLWTYGSWIGGQADCDSWHNAGRAFDLARVRVAGGEFVSCRYDLWRTETGRALESRLKAYWRLAASLHRRFAHVLTYAYNSQHHNHIHVDNGRSGAEPSRFRTGSPAQVQAVQSICRHVWGQSVEATGRWDAGTRDAVGAVLDTLGLHGSLSDLETWQAFLDASALEPG